MPATGKLQLVEAVIERFDRAPVGERRRWSDEFKAQAVTAALEVVLEPEDQPEHAGKQKVLIGEDVSERLDVITAKFRVIRCPAAHV